MPRITTTNDPIEPLLPTSGWLREYVDFSQSLEACTRFRFFSACCALGAAINNKVWIQRGDVGLLPRLFPNLWVLLLAPPGQGHKTSTINMGVNCLTQGCPEVRILADKITPESLVKALSEPQEKEIIRIGPRDATGLVKAPEFSVFFGKQQYNSGLVSLITDLYDYREEWKSDTIGRGVNVLRNNCISIIGGSTPDWLQSMLPQDAFTGGFMSRFVIVEMPPTYCKRCALPKRNPETEASWERLVQGMRGFVRLRGEIEWPLDCQKYYEKLYDDLTPTGETQRDAYQQRESEQVLKLGMLLAISQHEMILRKDYLQHANKLLKCLLEETVPRIERLTTHPRMKLVQDMQDLLRTRREITHKDLLRAVYRSLSHGEQQFNEAIKILLFAGIVKKDGSKSAMNPTYVLIKDDPTW